MLHYQSVLQSVPLSWVRPHAVFYDQVDFCLCFIFGKSPCIGYLKGFVYQMYSVVRWGWRLFCSQKVSLSEPHCQVGP